MPERIAFKPRKGTVLTPFTARIILELPLGRPVKVPVDFGLGRAEAVRNDEGVILTHALGESMIELGVVKRLAESEKVLFISAEGDFYFVEIRAKHYYKLMYLGENVAPTIEIDGVHMHNIKETTPLQDASRKVGMLRVKRGEVGLDICTGLGYTAIESLNRGAVVTTIEADPNVLWIAEHNPFSRKLADADIVLGDALDVLDELPEKNFDFALHDPPVFAFSPRLYSREFYAKLHRVLKPGARVFHYTGAPGRQRGVNIQRGVAERLRLTGFKIIKVVKGYGILALKT
ncbi:methyltransferase [Infirmifilum uzonense]|uniref:Methyltransferase n=1 Tax=Infirmifilum uzonense TaxID=1550241 RepID=A0A0F7FJ73_9CREN|nr:methyltransferase domain-containing protein [Infirmifilum uzonense]AKG39047.1 methyltransferase [Infirmifilum uzonense]